MNPLIEEELAAHRMLPPKKKCKYFFDDQTNGGFCKKLDDECSVWPDKRPCVIVKNEKKGKK